MVISAKAKMTATVLMGRIVARDCGQIGETFRQKAEVKGSSVALFYQLGAKMKCNAASGPSDTIL
jgi:hypothetical protein